MTTENEPAPIEWGMGRVDDIAISQGFRIGDFVVVSGQTSDDDDGNLIGEGDFSVQGHKTFENLRGVLEAGNSSLDDVVKVTIYVTDMSNYDEVVKLRREYFSRPYPADTILEVTALAEPGFLIEVEAMAMVKKSAD